MTYERANIQRLKAYTPGEQPRRADVVKLNTNENPYPPAQRVLDVIRGVCADSLRKYPPSAADSFRQVAARVHRVTPEQVIATNGGDELLRLAITTFCEPHAATNSATGATSGGGGVGIAEPGYSLYPVLADIHDTPVTRVLLDDDWAVPDDFADRLLDAGCRLALVVSPHAPSGRLRPTEQLERIARRLQGSAVLLVDEAYVDFAPHDASSLLEPGARLDNVILLRTFSKGYSLAGLRLGYGLGHSSLIEAMDKARDSYNMDVLAQVAAVAALEARAEAAETWRRVIDERTRLTRELTDLGFAVEPSGANFILVQPPPPKVALGGTTRAADIYQSLKHRGIFVRYFDQERLRDRLRITVGTPEQNDALIAAVAQLIAT